MRHNRNASPCRRSGRLHFRQRGVVLFIALIVMVAMSLAAIALMRSVDTTSQVIGNLAFRQASILPANLAIEDAAKSLFADAGGPRIPQATLWSQNFDSTWNYCGTHPCPGDGQDDAHGVPPKLQTTAAVNAAGFGQKFTDGASNKISYVIERMCNAGAPVIPADNSPAGTWCDMMQPKGAGCHEINQQCAFDFNPQPFYRITVRVDGPQNTVSFLQAMVR